MWLQRDQVTNGRLWIQPSHCRGIIPQPYPLPSKTCLTAHRNFWKHQKFGRSSQGGLTHSAEYHTAKKKWEGTLLPLLCSWVSRGGEEKRVPCRAMGRACYHLCTINIFTDTHTDVNVCARNIRPEECPVGRRAGAGVPGLPGRVERGPPPGQHDLEEKRKK